MVVEIGGWRVDAVLDGEGGVPASDAFAGVPAGAWAVHGDCLDDEGRLPMAVGAFLLRGHGRTVLVDLGYGPGMLGDMPTGSLLDSLRRLGVRPGDVTDVLLTHLHRDHVGWAAVDGVPTFPAATIRCHRADLAYFVDDEHDSEVAQRMRACEAQLEAFDGTASLPAVDVEPAPGHTPGSTIVVVSDRRRRAVILGDVVHAPVQLLEPAWDTVYDVDGRAARRTREQLLDRFADEPDTLLAGAHFPAMRFGRLVVLGGRRWLT